MRRSFLLLFFFLLVFASANVYSEKTVDSPGDLSGNAGKLSKLAELSTFEYVFHGPDYLKCVFAVGDKFPEKADFDLTYYLDFSFDSTAAANTTGEWKPDGTIAFKPYDRPNRFKATGSFNGLEFTFISKFLKDNKAIVDLSTRGIRTDWFARLRIRSEFKRDDKVATDIIENVWMFPRVMERYGGTPIPDLPPEDKIDLKEDELGRMMVGLFEFALGEERGLIDIKRHNGKYFATVAWYGGQITHAPLFLLKTHLKPKKKRKKFDTIASVDIAFKTHFGWRFNSRDPRPSMITFPKFNGVKGKTEVLHDVVKFETGELYSSSEKEEFTFKRMDRKPEIWPDRRAYLDRMLKEQFISSAKDAYRTALSLFNAIASEDWTPGLELVRLGGFENKQYIARRMERIAGMIDHFPDCDQELRERALKLRWRIHTNVAVGPVLLNEDVGRALRVPVLVYIFPKTEAVLDDHYSMKTEFTKPEQHKIKRGLIKGAELLFQETKGYFTPHFTFYDETDHAKELPSIDRLGRGIFALNPNEEGANDYYLLLQNMMQYTAYVNEYNQNTDYMEPDEYEKKGMGYPIIFMIGKVDSKNFTAMTRTRSQSDNKFKNAGVVTGVSYTKGMKNGHPAYCHIVLDKGFKEKDLQELVHWAITLIMLDNIYQMKGQFKMQFLQQGLELFPDVYTDIEMFDCENGTADWWNALLNAYFTRGLRKMFCYGRRPYFMREALQHPQMLGDIMRFGEYDSWMHMKKFLDK